jgi:hypothetical protein
LGEFVILGQSVTRNSWVLKCEIDLQVRAPF